MTQSKRWLQEHERDLYVKRAKKEGYASRAAFKLLEMHKKCKLFRPEMAVVDLGAAPGGWSQVAKELVGPKRAWWPSISYPCSQFQALNLSEEILMKRKRLIG